MNDDKSPGPKRRGRGEGGHSEAILEENTNRSMPTRNNWAGGADTITDVAREIPDGVWILPEKPAGGGYSTKVG